VRDRWGKGYSEAGSLFADDRGVHPDARLHILPGAGHVSFWEAAAAFNRVVWTFYGISSTP